VVVVAEAGLSFARPAFQHLPRYLAAWSLELQYVRTINTGFRGRYHVEFGVRGVTVEVKRQPS